MATAAGAGEGNMELDAELVIVPDTNSDNSSSSSSVQILSQSQGSSGRQTRSSAAAAAAASVRAASVRAASVRAASVRAASARAASVRAASARAASARAASARAASASANSSSSRTDPGSGSNTVSRIGIPFRNEKDFLKVLECPICMETVTPPVVNCTNGHIICSICRPRLTNCGLCHAPYTNSRNYAIEGILSLIEANCPFSLCGQKVQLDKLAEHVDICDYRPIKCFETFPMVCRGKDIDFSTYINHLVQDHKLDCINAGMGKKFLRFHMLNKLHAKWPVVPFTIGVQTFFLHRVPNESRSSLRMWITTLLPKDEDATMYSFFVRIFPPRSKNNPTSHLQWNIRAHSVHMQVKDIIEASDIIVISNELIEPYCEPEALPPPYHPYKSCPLYICLEP